MHARPEDVRATSFNAVPETPAASVGRAAEPATPGRFGTAEVIALFPTMRRPGNAPSVPSPPALGT